MTRHGGRSPMPSRSAALMTLEVLVAATGAAGQQVRDTAECEVRKARCSLQRVNRSLGCERAAALRGTPVDPGCALKAAARFDSTIGSIPIGCMNKAEARGDACLTLGDAPAIGAKIDALVDDLRSTLYVNPFPTEANVCWAKQTKCLFSYVKKIVVCYRKGVATGGDVHPGCLEDAAAAFSNASATGCMDKLDAPERACTLAGLPGQAATVKPVLDAFVTDLRAELMPDKAFELVTQPGLGVCGAVGDGSSTLLPLDCGDIALGGGSSVVAPSPTPPGSTTDFAVVDGDVVGVPASWGARRCSSAGCPFGAPFPLDVGPLSSCVGLTFTGAASGALDVKLGTYLGDLPLQATVTITSNATQPCPRCVGGACDATADNAGAACQEDATTGESHDCIASGPVLSPVAVSLAGVTTGTVTATDPGGVFCPGQTDVGAFGEPAATTITAFGSPAGNLNTGQPPQP